MRDANTDLYVGIKDFKDCVSLLTGPICIHGNKNPNKYLYRGIHYIKDCMSYTHKSHQVHGIRNSEISA